MWYYEDDDSLNLDIGMIKKFARLKITAPMNKNDIEKTVKELEELHEALQEKGDIERKESKARFLNKGFEHEDENEEKK